MKLITKKWLKKSGSSEYPDIKTLRKECGRYAADIAGALGKMMKTGEENLPKMLK